MRLVKTHRRDSVWRKYAINSGICSISVLFFFFVSIKISQNRAQSKQNQRFEVNVSDMTEIRLFEDFKKLSLEEQKEIVGNWDPYDASDGQPLRSQVSDEFNKTYGFIKGLEIHGVSNCHGSLVIGVSRPLVFDSRLLPEYFLGFPVYVMVKDMPEDFAVYENYVWAPENYENYVDLHEDEIRNELGDPNMPRREMLDILCGRDFDEWVEQCRSWGMTEK